MLIKGTKTRTESIEVDVNPYDLIESINKALREKIIPKELLDVDGGAYINSKGVWESWENGHGSGYTTTYREATEAEIQAWKYLGEWTAFARLTLR